MQQTSGLFSMKHVTGDMNEVQVIGKDMVYTLTNVEFVSGLPEEIRANILAEVNLGSQRSASSFAVTTLSPKRGRTGDKYIVGYNTRAKSGYPPSKATPKLTWAKGSETLRISAAELIKGGETANRFILSQDAPCTIFKSAKDIQNTILRNLRSRQKEHKKLADFLESYFNGDLLTIDTTEIDNSSLLQVAKYVGELIPGIAAFRGAKIFTGTPLPLFDIKEFVIPISSSFATVDSMIVTKSDEVIQISSKAAGGANPAFIPNVIAAAQSKHLIKDSYFKHLVKHKEKTGLTSNPYVYSLLNEILFPGVDDQKIGDPLDNVYTNIRRDSNKLSNATQSVIQRIKQYIKDGRPPSINSWQYQSRLDTVKSPMDQTILDGLPNSVTSFLGRVIANEIMADDTSIDQISKVLGAKDYYQFNLKKIKEDDKKAPIIIEVAKAGKLMFTLTAGKGAPGDITMAQGVLNFKLS